MAFIERRDGVIVGVYANPQPGYAEKEMADDAPEVVAFRTPPEQPKVRDLAAEIDALKATLVRKAVLTAQDVAVSATAEERP